MPGGTVSIEAEVTDVNGDIEQVTVELTAPDGTKTSLRMSPSERPSVYRCLYRIPGNPREDGQDMVYRVTVKALDSQGLKAVGSGGSITVKAARLPPPPPFGG